MRERDRTALTALRSTLAAIDNAEAVDTATRAGAIEAAVGLGAAEVARRELSDAQVEAIVRAEIAERKTAASEYEGVGESARADALRAEAAVLTAQLG
ncbi:hypothetical protein FOS14_10110 [Skermania sp. ID1734]|nr:GatB/YqeY domain-containing protein [Skermania sp. ID1734]TSE00189.1 hypothetical protein FOS14_10110 [Skermania sp. ID1734]